MLTTPLSEIIEPADLVFQHFGCERIKRAYRPMQQNTVYLAVAANTDNLDNARVFCGLDNGLSYVHGGSYPGEDYNGSPIIVYYFPISAMWVSAVTVFRQTVARSRRAGCRGIIFSFLAAAWVIIQAMPTAALFDLSRIVADERREPYVELWRVPALSLGVYSLTPDDTDRQQPHSEDEAYYVISGRGVIRIDGVDYPAQSGALIFVAAHAPHHFHSITETLQLLVFFAPAEGALAAGTPE